MSIELNSLVVRGENILSTPIDNELVILNVAKNNYVGLDEIGLRIWELLEKPIRVAELCKQLSREFDAAPEQIIEDTIPFLADLNDEGLINLADEQRA